MSHVDNAAIFSVKTPQGEYKSLGMHLKELREEIAKAIEAESLLEEYQDGYPGAMKRVGMAIAAEIARGER